LRDPGLGTLNSRLVTLVLGAVGKDTKLHSAAVPTPFPVVQGGFSFVGDPVALIRRGVPRVGLASRSSAISSLQSATKSRLSAAHLRSSPERSSIM
jgi:hypothetical protein